MIDANHNDIYIYVYIFHTMYERRCSFWVLPCIIHASQEKHLRHESDCITVNKIGYSPEIEDMMMISEVELLILMDSTP